MDALGIFGQALAPLLARTGQLPLEPAANGDWALVFDDKVTLYLRAREAAGTVLLYARLGPVDGENLCAELLKANWHGAALGLAFSLEEASGQALASRTLAMAALTPASLLEAVEAFAGQVQGWAGALAGAAQAASQPAAAAWSPAMQGLLRV